MPWNASELCEYLRVHRDEYVDEIPAELVSGVRGERGDRPKYKVQKNWFNGVIGALELGRGLGLMSGEELNSRIDKFINCIASDEFRQRDTRRGDIDAANTIISEVIAHLRANLNA